MILSIILLAIVAGIALVYFFLLAPIVKMPGRSFKGALPALNDQQRLLAERLRSHVVMLASQIGARSLTSAPEGLEASASYVEQTFLSFSLSTSSQSFAVGSTRMQAYLRSYLPDYPVETLIGKHARNVIAELPGDGSSDEIIVIGAHYDTPMDLPGANDNGSGVAAMLEIARALAGKKLARTVRFVGFVNEEPPFFRTEDMGSAHYARLCHERGDRVVAMMSLETIGCYSQEVGSQKYPPPFNLLYPKTGNFITFIANSNSRKLVRRCVSLFRKHTHFPSEGAALPARVPGSDFSDHLWFWHYGYPAMMVTDTAYCRYKHYHTGDDTPDKIDYESTARVVAGLIGMIEELAGPAR